MRDIKFRVWRAGRKEMIYRTFEQILDGVGDDCPTYDTEEFSYEVGCKKAEPMMFTGLLDKNNKEIYEGDCLGDYEDEKWVCYGAVSFYDYNATYILIGEDGYATDYESYDNSDWDKLEVIGNIYENPELVVQDD